MIKTSQSPLHPDSGMVHPRSSEITPEAAYQARRQWLKGMGVAGLGLAGCSEKKEAVASTPKPANLAKLPGVRSTVAGAMVMETPTTFNDVTTYNNFYEFGTGKDEPAENAHTLQTRPWTVRIDGEVDKPITLGIEDLLKLGAMEERIYRLRCVEGWSMVIPWVGYSLSTILKRVQPNSRAKYVEFTTLADPKQMPGVRSPVLDWPYVEGLRIDEAMHPLTLMAFGLYGQELPKQNGAPMRLVVPWKYGFKSAKSIVRIRLVEKQPMSSWQQANPREYGFFSNVNPEVDHPRWSQSTERRIGSDGGLFAPRKPTLMFNGYGTQVAQLYAGLDLRKNF